MNHLIVGLPAENDFMKNPEEKCWNLEGSVQLLNKQAK